MNNEKFETTKSELIKLLDQQMRALLGRSLDDLTNGERASYDARRTRIEALQSALRQS
jgi:hypothetical protein